MNLHTIGDCHSDIPWYNMNASETQFEQIYNNGMGYTLTTFGIRKLDLIDISTSYHRGNWIPMKDPERRKYYESFKLPYQHEFNIKDGDAVIFGFGEIDCRGIFSFSGYSETWKEMVDIAIPNYFDAIKANVEKFNRLHTMVFNIIPTTRNEYIHPHFRQGSSSESRKEVTLYMNKLLKENCEKYNYIFFNVYDKYCDEDGYLSRELSDDSFHIGNPIYYYEFLNNLKFT